MDTTLLQFRKADKTLSNIIGIGIATILLLSQNLYLLAQETNYNGYTGFSPGLVYILEENQKKEKIFQENIALKYSNSTIREIEKGVQHVRMTKYYNNKPIKINIVEISTDINSELEIEPLIASKTLASRSKISNIAQKKDAIVAINGGYFKPQTGIPLGTLMIDKKVYTGPIYDRVALGFFDDSYKMARVKMNSEILTNIGGFKIDNVNQPRMLSTHAIVYTRDWGKTTPPSPKYGSQLVINKGKLVGITESSVEIPEDGFVIIAPTQKLEPMLKAKKFKLSLKTTPEWKGVNHIISGGPYLVKNGEVFVDMTAQKLSAIGGRNPRTAIGYTKENNLIMLTADGREGASIGLTLIELANLMKELGCVYAMNLDGGGSTVMYVDGEVVNKPAVKGGIPLSHALVVSKKI